VNSIMSSEIRQQPEALQRTLDALLPLRPEIRALARDCRSVMYVARGSSDNAAVYGRYLMETHAGMLASLAAPSVGTHYDAQVDLTDVLVVSLSQSGETAEIVATQGWATRRGARTLAVTNAPRSSLASSADLVLATQAGEERAVPATKTYTSQLAAMAVLGTALAPDRQSLDAELLRAPEEMHRLLQENADVDAAITLLADADDVLVSGRGLFMGTALEIALKLEETCLRPVRGLSYADLRHGPIAVVSPDLVAVLVSANDGPLADGMAELAEDLRERDVKGIVGLGGTEKFRQTCDVALPAAMLTEAVAPLAAVIPGQILAERLAVRLGRDPDAPRGLRKVTQTDRSTT
jgi:glucosamine--fructose-6-phosphate aminotransferase (isomerizing)